MNKRQMGVYSICRTLEQHFDDDSSVWDGFAPIIDSKAELSDKIIVLAALLAAQMINLTGIAESKEIVRRSLEEQAFVLSAAICSYASVTKDTILYNGCFYNMSTLKQFKGDALVGAVTYLLAEGRKELANLDRYNVTDTSLILLKSTIDSFTAIMKRPEDSIKHRSTTTHTIETKTKEMLTFLNKQLDNMVVMLLPTAPEFVETYKALRVIATTGTRHLALTITTMDAATLRPIAHVNLEIVGKNIKRVSSIRGFNTVQNLVGGAYQIRATQQNYFTKTESFTIVPGETTELIILLNAVV
ncbi:hypothetical protein [Flavobacterium sp. SM2513]|uniref:hypothetical protein n=1 Tax=Flavobacterium sp. SM2513 TaxID=3424766 RepID=UPI003D7F261B